MDPRFQQPHPDQRARPALWGWALAGFLVISAFFLFSEHRAHFFGALPWLLLLACPFLHFFMHGGHGHGGKDSHESHGNHNPGDRKGGES